MLLVLHPNTMKHATMQHVRTPPARSTTLPKSREDAERQMAPVPAITDTASTSAPAAEARHASPLLPTPRLTAPWARPTAPIPSAYNASRWDMRDGSPSDHRVRPEDVRDGHRDARTYAMVTGTTNVHVPARRIVHGGYWCCWPLPRCSEAGSW